KPGLREVDLERLLKVPLRRADPHATAHGGERVEQSLHQFGIEGAGWQGGLAQARDLVEPLAETAALLIDDLRLRARFRGCTHGAFILGEMGRGRLRSPSTAYIAMYMPRKTLEHRRTWIGPISCQDARRATSWAISWRMRRRGPTRPVGSTSARPS